VATGPGSTRKETHASPRPLQLVRLWEEGRFPVDRIMTFYDFDQIEQAAKDADEGRVIKPVLRMR
jgi:aryl-alcohol dehydrogenase